MKIKIVKCSKDTYWYYHCIGRVFETIVENPEYPECYRVWRDKNTNSVGFVQKEDAEVLPLEKFDTLTSIVEQLESCEYVTKDNHHELKMNIAFISLKEMAKKEQDG